MKKKIQVTEDLVRDHLPEPPAQMSYTIERVTPRVIKVWINDHHTYSYTPDPVRSIYAYVKGEMVHPPKNREKMRVEPLCHITDLSMCDPWSTINDTHDHPSLLHL